MEVSNTVPGNSSRGVLTGCRYLRENCVAERKITDKLPLDHLICDTKEAQNSSEKESEVDSQELRNFPMNTETNPSSPPSLLTKIVNEGNLKVPALEKAQGVIPLHTPNVHILVLLGFTLSIILCTTQLQQGENLWIHLLSLHS